MSIAGIIKTVMHADSRADLGEGRLRGSVSFKANARGELGARYGYWHHPRCQFRALHVRAQDKSRSYLLRSHRMPPTDSEGGNSEFLSASSSLRFLIKVGPLP
eukprot:48567-Rhodomonas_salina.5